MIQQFEKLYINRNSCFKCLKSMNKNPGMSLHKFPKNKLIRQEWLNACGFCEQDIINNRKICSFHFESNCYIEGRKTLKPNAVPSKFSKLQVTCDHKQHNKSNETKSNTVLIEASTPTVNDISVLSNETLLTKSPNANSIFETIIETPKRKRRLCYIGDVKTPDFDTPKRAKVHFKRAKYQVMIQKQKIKRLNETVRRLRKKIVSIESLLNHLKKQNYITENAHDEILRTTSESIKETINRSLKLKNAKFSPAISAKKRQDADAIMNNDNDIDNESDLFEEFEHDYDYRMPELEEYVTDVVKYTSGFIVRKIKKNKKLCNVCDSMLTVENNENASRLLKLKTRGKLITPTTDVHKICLTTEYIIRMNLNILLTHKNIKQILIVKTMNEICHESTIFNSQLMKTHILNQDPLDNHRSQLLNIIINFYITLRMHHYAKMHTLSITGKNVRRNLTKLILFKNQ
ncbi:hypothetical protein ACI65C_006711 [Semiaphis heraclei]